MYIHVFGIHVFIYCCAVPWLLGCVGLWQQKEVTEYRVHTTGIQGSTDLTSHHMTALRITPAAVHTLRLQLFAGTFFSGFVLFYVSLVLNFQKCENIIF